jgi:hypothetical protein
MTEGPVDTTQTLRSIDSAFDAVIARSFAFLCAGLQAATNDEEKSAQALLQFSEALATARRARIAARALVTDPAWKAAGGMTC